MTSTRYSIMLLSLALTGPAIAQEGAGEPSEVLAKRGEGVVTHDLFDARVARIPEEDRARFLRDRRRLQDLLNQLLLQAQLAVAAREAGLDRDPTVQARMKYAAEEELAKAWLQQYPALREPADYEAMAREHYTANKDRYKTKETLDLTHLLVGLEERTEEEALERATQLYGRIEANPEIFDDLVVEFSDDPSATSNRGQFEGVERGQMVKPFEDVAFRMADGEISEPVKTIYGYHIIRMDRVNPPRLQSYEEVHEMLVDRMRRQHEERVRNDYLSWLNQHEVEMTEEALETMVNRYFGEDTEPRKLPGAESE